MKKHFIIISVFSCHVFIFGIGNSLAAYYSSAMFKILDSEKLSKANGFFEINLYHFNMNYNYKCSTRCNEYHCLARCRSIIPGLYLLTLESEKYLPYSETLEFYQLQILNDEIFLSPISCFDIDSISPSTGFTNQHVTAVISGKNFNSKTRVSMSLDTGNKKAIVGSIEFANPVEDIAIIGNTTYVANMYEGIKIIDTSSLIKPIEKDCFDTQNIDKGLLIHTNDNDEKIIFSIGEEQFQILDANNTEKLTLIETISMPDKKISDITINKNIAYAIWNSESNDKEWGIGIFNIEDVSKLSNTFPMGSLYIPNQIEIFEDIAYITGHSIKEDEEDIGLHLIDISNPFNLKLIAKSDIVHQNTYGLTIKNEKAYIACGSDGLKILDISNPNDLTITGKIVTSGFTNDVVVINDLAYLASGYNGGLQIVNIKTPSKPSMVGYFDTPGNAKKLKIIGDKAYVADGEKGLQIIDISQHSSFNLVGQKKILGVANDICIIGNIAYVATENNGIQIFDVSDPSNPVEKGILNNNTLVSANGICVIENIAYVVNESYGLQIVNISDLTNIYFEGAIKLSGIPLKVVVINDIAYVVCGGENGNLSIINLLPHDSPSLISSVEIFNASGLDIDDNKAYVSFNNLGVRIVDITDLYNPKIEDIQNSHIIFDANDISIHENFAYVSRGDKGLDVLDISNPLQTVLIGRVETPGEIKGFEVINDLAYVADGEVGITIVPIPCEITDVTVESETKISLNIPPMRIPGNYTIGVFNENGNFDKQDGILTIFDKDDFDNVNNTKVIICAASITSSYTEDNLWNAFELNASKAYKTIIELGYNKDHIKFLCANTQIEGVTGLPTKENFFEDALNNWGKDAANLIVYMIGHGFQDSFALNYSEKISPDALNDSLNNLQENIPGQLIVIFDACNSGIFLQQGSSSENKTCIVITSSAPDKDALFAENGRHSFSYRFWDHIVYNKKLDNAYFYARNKMKSQSPMIDANGNGMSEEKEDKIAANNIILGYDFVSNNDIGCSMLNINRPDNFEQDDSMMQATIINNINFNAKFQCHNFHKPEDNDWLAFWGTKDKIYKIEAQTPGMNCDPVISVINVKGEIIAQSDDGVLNDVESIEWECPDNNFYYIKVHNYYANKFGENTEYGLKVFMPYAHFPGEGVIGRIYDVNTKMVPQNRILIHAGSFQIKNINPLNGLFYENALVTGNHSLKVFADGYQDFSSSITIKSGIWTKQDIILHPLSTNNIMADINANGSVDLNDAILTLKVLSDMNTSDYIRDDYTEIQVDINNDKRIGLEELVYILKMINE